MVDVLLGLQWGDEGKGKIVDYLAHQYDVIARFQGGPNAGHTLYVGDRKIVLHNIPSGVFHDRPVNLMGNGMVIDPVSFEQEVKEIESVNVQLHPKLFIARRANLILPTHRLLDKASELAKGKNKIGSTLRGIAPTYKDKTGRSALRIGDLESPDFQNRYNALKTQHEKMLSLYDFDYTEELIALEKEWFASLTCLKSFTFVDSEYFVNDYLSRGKRILAEGAQGSMLDITFGTYPYVTSSNTLSSGVCEGIGVAPHQIKEVFGVTKAYCTRVGAGPFPSELVGNQEETLRQAGGEFGATTGRPRRCGWIDLPALKYSIMLSGVTQLVMTKIDVLSIFESIEVCDKYIVAGKATTQLPYELTRSDLQTAYQSFEGWGELTDISSFEVLPASLKTYLRFVEAELGIPVTMISVGPKRDELIVRNVGVEKTLVM